MNKISKISLSLLLIPTITFCSEGKQGKGHIEIWRRGQNPSAKGPTTAFTQAQRLIDDYEKTRACGDSEISPTAPPSSPLTAAQPAQATSATASATAAVVATLRTQPGSSDHDDDPFTKAPAPSQKSFRRFTDDSSGITAVSAVKAPSPSSSPTSAQASLLDTAQEKPGHKDDGFCHVSSDSDDGINAKDGSAAAAQAAPAANDYLIQIFNPFARVQIPPQDKPFIPTTALSLGLLGQGKGSMESEEAYLLRLIAACSLANACSTEKGTTHPKDQKIMERFPQALRNLLAILSIQTKEQKKKTIELMEQERRKFDTTRTRIELILASLEEVKEAQGALPESAIKSLQDLIQMMRHEREALIYLLHQEHDAEILCLRNLEERLRHQSANPNNLRPLSPLRRPRFVPED